MLSDTQLSKLTACFLDSGTQDVIRNLQPAEHTHISVGQRSSPASLGCLNCLADELLFMILDSLDFQSLSRLARVSILVRSLVEQLPAYRDMMAHAPQTLTALGKTGLLSYHSAFQLRRVLRSENCASCTIHFGGYLLLPTCERVCYDCLRLNFGLRVTTVAMAKECFRLSDRQLKSPGGIPIMFSIPGEFSTGWPVRRNRVYCLVCVKQAKKLAIKVHGSAEAVQAFRPPESTSSTWRTRKQDIMACFHDALTDGESPGCEILAKSVIEDDYGGMAVIRFPFLDDNESDFGTLCLGCEIVHREYINGNLPVSVLASLDLQLENSSPTSHLHARMQRLWSKRGFLQHVEKCYGAQRLLRQWGNSEQGDKALETPER